MHEASRVGIPRLSPTALRIATILATGGVTALYFLTAFAWARRTVEAAGEFADAPHVAPLTMGLNALFGAVFFLLVGGITLVRSKPAWRQRRIIGWVLPFAVLIPGSLVARGEPREMPLLFSMVACALVISGTLFTLYALRYLGRNYAVISDVRGLVTSGPYALVRHPLYLGETIALFGFMLTIASPLAVTAFIVSTSLQVWRAKVEEEALATVYPEYHLYAARTPRIFPNLRGLRAFINPVNAGHPVTPTATPPVA